MRTPGARAAAGFYRAVAIAALAIGGGVCLPPVASAQDTARRGTLAPLARYFPGQDLVAYLEFDGLDSHQESWRRTAAYRLLNETTTGAMYLAALPRVFGLLLREQGDVPLNGRELAELVVQLFRSGFAVGINRAGGTGPPRSFALVVRGGAKGETQKLLDRGLRAGATRGAGVRNVQMAGGRTVQQLGAGGGQTTSWWAEGEDLVVSLVSAGTAGAVIDALDGRVKNAVLHPTRLALLESADAPGFEPVGMAFFDMAAFPPLPKEAVSLGLDRIKRFEYRWGFHGDALFSIVSVAVPAPRSGIPAFFDQPKLDVRTLPPLPGRLAGFTIVSLDGAQLAPRLRHSLAALIPSGAGREEAEPDQIADSLRELLGLTLHDDLFAHLGTRFTFYNVASKVNGPSHILESIAQGFFRAPRMALVADVKNRDRLAVSLDRLYARAREALGVAARNPNGLALGSIERLKTGESGFVFSFVGSEIPAANTLRPTLLLGKRTLVLASTPAMARRARDHAESSERGGLPPGDPLGAKLDWLPADLTLLSVADTAHSVYPELIVGLPGLAETGLRSRRFMPFAFLMGESVVDLMPEVANAGVISPRGPGSGDDFPPWDAELVPEPDDLRPFLFPSVQALAVDQAGIRLISREAIPTLNPSTAVPIALGAILPIMREAQLSRDRARATNNLKQIGLAFQNFHDRNNHFPNDIRSKEGKPLLSWRVAILPLLEQGELFKKFRQDEPWDSPQNKALIAEMPAVFAIDGSDTPEPGQTFYRGFAGPGTMFDPKYGGGIAIADILDGTSNTILIVEAREAVPWTKPESELAFDGDQKPEKLKAMLEGLGGHSKGGFNALFCNGAVRFIRSNVSLPVLQGLITRAAGEVISSDSF